MNIEGSRPDRDGLIAFVHIPETGGTTLNSIIARQYRPEETYEVMMRGPGSVNGAMRSARGRTRAVRS
jgi:hypothetical protein